MYFCFYIRYMNNFLSYLFILFILGYLTYMFIKYISNNNNSNSNNISKWFKNYRYKGSDNTVKTIDDKYNLSKQQKEIEMNRILEKINKYGMISLSRKEKIFLTKYNK